MLEKLTKIYRSLKSQAWMLIYGDTKFHKEVLAMYFRKSSE